MRPRASVLLLIVTIAAAALSQTGQPPQAQNNDVPRGSSTEVFKKVEIHLDRAVEVPIPARRQSLKATAFEVPDGKSGWVVQIPGERPIATPAYADGMIFVGGGYSSHEFYAFNAETGQLVWQVKTSDDGPTAAVVEDGYVAFNTESCTLIILDEMSGRIVWEEWLGDPLMSQPAIAHGRVYIAYPAGQRRPQKPAPDTPSAKPGNYHLLSADLKTGRHLWELEIPTDVISAPIVADGKVYFTCFDGSSFAVSAADGRVIWKKQGTATSAPLLAQGQVVITRKEKVADSTFEGLARREVRDGSEKDQKLLARSEANYLNEGQGEAVPLSLPKLKALDSLVGFGSAPTAAKLEIAADAVGVNTVAGGWAYQGSRPAFRSGKILNAQGRYLNAVDATTGKVLWRAEASDPKLGKNARVFSPPALGQNYMYVGSATGLLAAVRQQDGEAGFLYALNHPIVFQPALARGKIYIGTGDGLLICLKTGSSDADGWYAWGGNAQHNR